MIQFIVTVAEKPEGLTMGYTTAEPLPREAATPKEKSLVNELAEVLIKAGEERGGTRCA